jgi:hypothetical protein
MVDFSKLKANSGKSSLEKLTQELNKLNSNQDSKKDNRLWYPEVDKAGNGYAVIRFLPSPGDEPVPFIRLFEHGFKGPTGVWYIENSLTTIGKTDPVSELNSKLWNISSDDNSPTRKQARAQKRKLHFMSNIYIIEDKANPENNGTVRLFKFGKKIYDKLNEAMNPQFADETPLNPFCPWEGANFKLKIRNVEGYRNYDKSEFASRSPLFDNDEDIEAVWRQEHSLQAFLAESNFKSYEELKKRLDSVLGMDQAGKVEKARKSQAAAEADDNLDDIPWSKIDDPKQSQASSSIFDEDDDDVNYFKSLANN